MNCHPTPRYNKAAPPKSAPRTTVEPATAYGIKLAFAPKTAAPDEEDAAAAWDVDAAEGVETPVGEEPESSV